MNIKTLNVFYGGDFLPYKDKERQVHYPNVGSDFQGAENITSIRFYIDEISSNNTTFAVAIELPNGKIGSEVLSPAQYDSEIGEYYVALAIDRFITQKVGNVSISLRGYQGDIELEYDDDSQLYVLVGGTPITAVTGAIKLRVNQEPQALQGEIDEEVTFQQILSLIATKLDIDKGIVIVGDIGTANLSGYEVGQIFYDNDTHTYYEKTDTSPYYTKALSGAGVLGAPNILCRSDDTTRTIAQLHTIYGDSKYIVLRYLDKDYLYFSKKVGSTYTCVAFDTEEQRFYKASGLSGSSLPSTMLVPANKIEIASKAFLSSNYVPYTGANSDINLGGHFINNAKTENLYLNHKEDEDNISSVKFVLENAFNLDEFVEIGEGEYPYLLKPNSTILYGGDIYKHITDTQTDLVYAYFNGSVTTQTDGTSLHLGSILKISKTEVGGIHQYNRESIDIDLYSKAQAKDKFATNLTLSMDSTTYVLTAILKNANGETLATQTIDLPLESIVTSMTYYDTYTYDGTTYHNVLVIVLATTSVPTIVPVGSLISGLEHEALVEVSDISTPLTADQLALLEYPNAMITYGNNVYLKAEDNGTKIILSSPFISVSTNTDHEEMVRKYIEVTKSSGAMVLTSDTTSFYDKSQADTLLSAKQDKSTAVSDDDIETLGGAVTRIRKGNTWNEVAEQVNMSTTPKVVQSVADLPADNDGYLYVVLDNGYLYSWDEENQEWAQQYQYTSDLLTITEVEVGGDDYSYIEDKTNDNRHIQVASASKDGNGDVIDETYAKISDIETIDERLDNHDTDIAKLKKDVDYAMKYPLLYGTPTTDTEEEVGLTTSQLPATNLPKGLINYVGGMSQKVNQLVINSDFANTSGWGSANQTKGTISIANNELTYSVLQVGTNYGNGFYTVVLSTHTGHKCLLFFYAKGSRSGIRLGYDVTNVASMGIGETETSYKLFASILTASTTQLLYICTRGGTTEVGDTISFKNVGFADLTEIYGVGNEPASTSDARIQELIHYITKHPEYDEGSIANANVENIASKGFNIWDEEWENKYIDANGDKLEYTNAVCSKNFIKVLPSTTYYIKSPSTCTTVAFYDKDNNYIGRETDKQNSTFTTPSNCYNILFSAYNYQAYAGSNVYKYDICINLSGTMNGTYLPYQAPSNYPIPAEVQALDGYGLGFSTTLFNKTDLENKVFRKVVVKIDLGTLNWGKWGAQVFGTGDTQGLVKIPNTTSDMPNAICSRLRVGTYYTTITDRSAGYGIAISSAGQLAIYSETDYADGNAIKTALSGVYLVCEIATPTETDISEYLDRDFPNENLIDTYQGGEVEFENDNDMGVPYSLTYQYKVE